MTKKRPTHAQVAAQQVAVVADGQYEHLHQAQAVTIYFDGDATSVAADYDELIAQCALKFKGSLSGLLIVAGHAASFDEPDQEVELSHLRTRAVAQQLEKHGVLSHQIVCVSRGANEPLVDPSDSARRWINRRVEISQGALVPRPPVWAQQRRSKKAAAGNVESTVAQDSVAAPAQASAVVKTSDKKPARSRKR